MDYLYITKLNKKAGKCIVVKKFDETQLVSTRLDTILAERKLTQTEFAEQADVDRVLINRSLKNGGFPITTQYYTFQKMADALNISIDELIIYQNQFKKAFEIVTGINPLTSIGPLVSWKGSNGETIGFGDMKEGSLKMLLGYRFNFNHKLNQILLEVRIKYRTETIPANDRADVEITVINKGALQEVTDEMNDLNDVLAQNYDGFEVQYDQDVVKRVIQLRDFTEQVLIDVKRALHLIGVSDDRIDNIHTNSDVITRFDDEKLYSIQNTRWTSVDNFMRSEDALRDLLNELDLPTDSLS
jgi:transcriptional regulator with XRE-family HTH domain